MTEPRGFDLAPGVMVALEACPDVDAAVTLAAAALGVGIPSASAEDLCWEAAGMLRERQPGLGIEQGILAAQLYAIAMLRAGYEVRVSSLQRVETSGRSPDS